MRIVIAPDKFKDCLSASAVTEAIARGLLSVDSGLVLDRCPMADGGEGTVDALVAATAGRPIRRTVTGPLPDMRVEATFGILGDGVTAAVEMAAASGVALLAPHQRNPMLTSTYGTGELLLAAAEAGAKRIILGIGGSATVDGGIGCAQACGCPIKLTDGSRAKAGDRPLTGADLDHVASIGPSPKLADIEIVVACDVTNPLFGDNGAAPIFGPQKGATPEQVRQLDSALKGLAERTGALSSANTPGAGAAGGLGFGMLAFFGARLASGIEIVMDAVGFRDRLANADLCITGEGRLDSQSLGGKTAIGVARAAKSAGVPCIAMVGAVGEGAEAALSQGLTAYFSICSRPMNLQEAMKDAANLLESAASNVVRTTTMLGRPQA